MSLKIFQQKIDDTSLTTGTGDLTLQGPSLTSSAPGSASASYLGSNAQSGDEVVLCLTDSAGNFEVSQCTVTITGTVVTISRDTVKASSADSLAKVSFTGVVRVSNYIPATLELVLFNLTYQAAANASLSQMATDISDMKDALAILIS